MAKVISIPRVGKIQFPDGMSDDEISQAAGEAHDNALMSGVMQFVAADPSLAGQKASEVHKQLGTVAAMLEKYPRLAQAIDAGMGQVQQSASAAPQTEGPQDQPQAAEGTDISQPTQT